MSLHIQAPARHSASMLSSDRRAAVNSAADAPELLNEIGLAQIEKGSSGPHCAGARSVCRGHFDPGDRRCAGDLGYSALALVEHSGLIQPDRQGTNKADHASSNRSISEKLVCVPVLYCVRSHRAAAWRRG